MNERTAAMYRAHFLGATLEEVGREHGVSRERIRQIFVDAGLPVRTRAEAHATRRRRAHTRAQVEREMIAELITSGKTQREIARELGLTLDSVRCLDIPVRSL